MSIYLILGPDDATLLFIQVHILKPFQKEPSIPVVPPLSPVVGLTNYAACLPPKPNSTTKRGSMVEFAPPTTFSIQKDSRVEATDAYDASNQQTIFFESAQLYRPPVFSDRYINESDVPPPVIRDRLIVEEFPVGTISTAWINMVKQGLSEWIRVPVIVARGVEPGPVVSFLKFLKF